MPSEFTPPYIFSIATWKTKVLRGFTAFLSENDKETKEGSIGRRQQDSTLELKTQPVSAFASNENVSPVSEPRSVSKEMEQQAFW